MLEGDALVAIQANQRVGECDARFETTIEDAKAVLNNRPLWSTEFTQGR